ncbi:MAG: flagellar motor stator protein MotA [Negativicutes bacterium]|nr:flagellar motor stator protein MotA [Negativicutes bacterium]
MELSTIIGIIAAIIGVGVGMVIKGVSPVALVNPAAILIIFVGTFAAVCNAFTMTEIKNWPKLFKKVIFKQPAMNRVEIVDTFADLAQIARREGILALESKAEELSEPYLREGLRMIIDGMDPEFVHDVLENEIHMMEERHRRGATVFSQAGSYAPTLGVLGAVVGLIAALSNMADTEALGVAIAAAFVATLFGIFSGYVLWHPFSNKLKVMSQNEVLTKRMYLEGILSLQAGDSPVALEAKLLMYLPIPEREQYTAFREAKKKGEQQ